MGGVGGGEYFYLGIDVTKVDAWLTLHTLACFFPFKSV